MPLKPIKHENLKVLIELEIKDFIESSQLKDGDRLPAEKDLAEALGASRTAVRESLRGLESLGFVESVHGVGWQVRRPDRAPSGRRSKRRPRDAGGTCGGRGRAGSPRRRLSVSS